MMGIKFWICSAVCVFACAGCHDGSRRVQTIPVVEGQELPILQTLTGAHSHETRPMRLVIRDPAALAQVPLTDVPVDFASQMLLVVTLGSVTSDQYQVGINRVWREGNKLRVEMQVKDPPEGSPVAMAAPYCIAVVPRCELNVAGFSADPPGRLRSWGQSPLPHVGSGKPTNKPHGSKLPNEGHR